MGEVVPESEVDEGGLGGVFLDGEAGPGQDFAGGEVFYLDGGGDKADEVDGVAKLLLPRNLGGLRWGRRSIGHGIGGALQLQLPRLRCSPAWEWDLEFGGGIRVLGECEEVPQAS